MILSNLEARSHVCDRNLLDTLLDLMILPVIATDFGFLCDWHGN